MTWRTTDPLPPDVYAEVRLRAIFECFRWDPQVEDVAALADFALVLDRETWAELTTHAERLAAETFAAEQELIQRPELHSMLGLPRAITRHWTRPIERTGKVRDVRLIRFDFHLTTEGWRISEANADVPGGFIEASGYSRLMAEQYPALQMTGDPAEQLAQAIRGNVQAGAQVAMVHATAFTDDRQVMAHIGQSLERAGLQPVLVSPAQVHFQDDQAEIVTDWLRSPADYLVRFFPAEWLPNLARSYPWSHYFNAAHVPSCNPTTALLVQSKRFPLVWDQLRTPLPAWRALLPETCDPRGKPAQIPDWLYKPALGRVGEDIGWLGLTDAKELRQIKRSVRWSPQHWVRQRRFEAVPLETHSGIWYPCIGVYTINGRAAGIYGRMNRTPLINATSTDIPVFIDRHPSEGEIPHDSP